MKKKIIIFLCCVTLCCFGTAFAEDSAPSAFSTFSLNSEPGSLPGGPVTDASELMGLWVCCGANDLYPCLVIHPDDTMEAYDYWQAGAEGKLGLGLMLFKGTFTLASDTGAVTLPNGETYTVTRAETPEDLETSAGDDASDAPYVLYWTGKQSGEPYDMGYVPVETVSCFPTVSELSYSGRSWTSEDGSQTLLFSGSNAYTLSTSDNKVNGTYALEGGRLSLTADTQTTILYIQFRCMPLEGISDSEQAAVEALQNYSDDPDLTLYTEGSSAYLDRGTLLVYGLSSDSSPVSFLRSDRAGA